MPHHAHHTAIAARLQIYQLISLLIYLRQVHAVACVYGPYDTAPIDPDTCGGNPTITFAYTAPVINSELDTPNFGLIVSPAHAVTNNRAVSVKGGDPIIIKTVTYIDGMKRIIQTKKDADVNGSYGTTVSGMVVFDDLGRVTQQAQPIFEAGFNTAFTPQPILRNPTIFAYDPLDRTTMVVAPDGATTTTSYAFGTVGNTGNLYAMTTVVDPEGNKVNGANRRGTKVSFKDVHDRIMAVTEYNNGLPIITNYAYDPLGQITTVVDAKNNTTTVEYDLLGRRTAITNPDTGKTSYGYDANGNLTSKLTAKNNNISYNYVFNRLTDITYPQSPTVHYDYGAMNEAYNRAGRIKKVTDESGTEERFYGKLGETTREIRTVLAHTPATQSKSFTTDYVFDSFGRMQEMTYPDGELLHYAYDDGGLLKAAWGIKAGNRYNYINSLLYDEFGQRTHIELGNNTKTNYSYDPLTRRLATLNTTLPDGSYIQKLTYQYDLVGNVKVLQNGILVATNTALPAGPVRQEYGYDDLYQLTSAKGAYGFGPGKENNYHNQFNYDVIGNMTIKNQVNQIIQPSTTVTLPKETNYVLNYVYGSSHPHAVTDAGDKLYSYDASGNMTGWTSKTSGQKRTIIWNEENRVKEIDDNGKATYFLYDDAGERVTKRGQYGETIYINRFYSVKNGELGTKHIFAGETRVLSKLVKTPNTVISNTTGTTPGTNGLNNGVGKKLGIIKRLTDTTTSNGVNPPIEKDEFFYHGDHLGSSNMITDAYGAVYQHLEYFPYGETWIDEGGSHGGNLPGYKFTGKELDPETGLYYFGARYYDAVLSKWISADPFLGKYLPAGNGNKESNRNLPGKGGVFNPVNINLYRYSSNNPLKYLDPNGTDDVYFNENGSIFNTVKAKTENIYLMEKTEGQNVPNAKLVGGKASFNAVAAVIYSEASPKSAEQAKGMGNVIHNRAAYTKKTPLQIVSGKNPIEGYGSDRYKEGMAAIKAFEKTGKIDPKLGLGEPAALQNAIAGALHGLGGGTDVTKGAYWWGHNASYFEDSDAFDRTVEIDGAQFYKYNPEWQKENIHKKDFP